MSKYRELRKYSAHKFTPAGQWAGHSLRRRISCWLSQYHLTRWFARRMWYHQTGICRFCGVDVGMGGVVWRAGLTCDACHDKYQAKYTIAPEIKAAALERLRNQFDDIAKRY